MGTKLDAATKKITLIEIDFAQLQAQWFNWTDGVWYVDFDAVYERIDPIYLVGVSSQPIVMVGSVFNDGVSQSQVGSVALVQSTNASWYFDATDRRLHVHLNNGDEPSIHAVKIGLTSGASNHAGYYNGIYYEPRVRNAPTFTKTKDPLFFGRISLDSAAVELENLDGIYDQIGENASSLFGSEIRALQGFDTDAYGSFVRLATRMVENVRINRTSASLDAVDKRKGLSRSLPANLFLYATYPYLNLNNMGKAIPLAYGPVKKCPVVCTNETESGPPAQYHFKLADTAGAGHSIKAIDTVYVKGISTAFTNTSLPNATFDISSTLYVPGDLVAVDFKGFQTGGVLITSPADVITDLLSVWLGIAYDATNFNTTEWAATKSAVDTAFPGGIALFVENGKEVYSIVQDICASTLLNMIPQDDGKFTLRMYSASRTVSQSFAVDELLEVPSYEYDTVQIISRAQVDYACDWSGGKYKSFTDTSQEATIFALYGKYNLGKFTTLLTTETDAQTFAAVMLSIQGAALRKFSVRFKMQPFDREIMDFIECYIWRPTKAMIGKVRAEVLSKAVVASSGVTLGCRIVANL